MHFSLIYLFIGVCFMSDFQEDFKGEDLFWFFWSGSIVLVAKSISSLNCWWILRSWEYPGISNCRFRDFQPFYHAVYCQIAKIGDSMSEVLSLKLILKKGQRLSGCYIPQLFHVSDHCVPCFRSLCSVFQITVFRMGEGAQDIDLAILTALLKGTIELNTLFFVFIEIKR